MKRATGSSGFSRSTFTSSSSPFTATTAQEVIAAAPQAPAIKLNLPSVERVYQKTLENAAKTLVQTVFISLDKEPELALSWTNWLTRLRTGSPIIHCEVYFALERESYLVSLDQCAGWLPNRTMQRSWIVLDHQVTTFQRQRIRELLDEYNGQAFDTAGWRCGVLCGSTACIGAQRTMCSRMIAEVYSHPDVRLLDPEDVEPCFTMTPPRIYELLEPHSRTGALAVKLDNFAAAGGFGI